MIYTSNSIRKEYWKGQCFKENEYYSYLILPSFGQNRFFIYSSLLPSRKDIQSQIDRYYNDSTALSSSISFSSPYLNHHSLICFFDSLMYKMKSNFLLYSLWLSNYRNQLLPGTYKENQNTQLYLCSQVLTKNVLIFLFFNLLQVQSSLSLSSNLSTNYLMVKIDSSDSNLSTHEMRKEFHYIQRIKQSIDSNSINSLSFFKHSQAAGHYLSPVWSMKSPIPLMSRISLILQPSILYIPLLFVQRIDKRISIRLSPISLVPSQSIEQNEQLDALQCSPSVEHYFSSLQEILLKIPTSSTLPVLSPSNHIQLSHLIEQSISIINYIRYHTNEQSQITTVCLLFYPNISQLINDWNQSIQSNTHLKEYIYELGLWYLYNELLYFFKSHSIDITKYISWQENNLSMNAVIIEKLLYIYEVLSLFQIVYVRSMIMYSRFIYPLMVSLIW